MPADWIVTLSVGIMQLLLRGSGHATEAGLVGDGEKAWNAFRQRRDARGGEYALVAAITQQMESSLNQHLWGDPTKNQADDVVAAGKQAAELFISISQDPEAALIAVRSPEKFRAYLWEKVGRNRWRQFSGRSHQAFVDILDTAAKTYIELLPGESGHVPLTLTETLKAADQILTTQKSMIREIQEVSQQAEDIKTITEKVLGLFQATGRRQIGFSLGITAIGDIPGAPPNSIYRPEVDTVSEASKAGRPVVILGARGVGKTTLAAAYLRLQRQRRDEILAIWVSGENEQTLVHDLAMAALELDAPINSDDERLLALHTRNFLNSCDRPCVLIVDNAEDPLQVGPWIPRDASRCETLITSTNRRFANDLAVPVELGVFAREESISFLEARTGNSDESGANAVADALGDLPLALGIGAALLVERRKSYDDLLERLHSQHLTSSLPGGILANYPRGLVDAVGLSISTVVSQHPESQTDLEVLALLDPSGVPEDIVIGIFLHVAGCDRRLQIEDELQALVNASLLRPTDDGKSLLMHRLVSRCILENTRFRPVQADVDPLMSLIIDVLGGLVKISPLRESVPVGHIEIADPLAQNMLVTLSHLDRCFANPQTSGDLTEAAARTAIVASLLASHHLHELGAYNDSMHQARRALQLTSSDTKQETIAVCHLSLGKNYYRAGDVAQASEHINTARHNSVGFGNTPGLQDEIALWDSRVLVELGRANEGIRILQEAVDRSPNPSRRRSDLLGNLGVALWRAGWYFAAQKKLQESIEMWSRVDVPDSDGIIQGHKHLCIVARDLGLLVDDFSWFSNALNEIEKSLQIALSRPESHPFFELCRLQHEQAKTQAITARDPEIRDVISQLELVWQEHRRIYFDYHPNTAGVRVDLAHALLADWRINDAQEHAQAAYDIFLSHYHSTHPYIHLPLEVFARASSAKGNHEKALHYFSRCLDILDCSYGRTHPYSVRIRKGMRDTLKAARLDSTDIETQISETMAQAELRAMSEFFDPDLPRPDGSSNGDA